MKKSIKVTTAVLSSVVLATGCSFLGGEKKIDKPAKVEKADKEKEKIKIPKENGGGQLSLEQSYEKENSISAFVVSVVKQKKTVDDGKETSVLKDIVDKSKYVVASVTQPLAAISDNILDVLDDVVVPDKQPAVIETPDGTVVTVPVIPDDADRGDTVEDDAKVPENPGSDAEQGEDGKQETPEKETLFITFFIPNDQAFWEDNGDYNVALEEYFSTGMLSGSAKQALAAHTLNGLKDNDLFFGTNRTYAPNQFGVKSHHQLLALGQANPADVLGMDFAQLGSARYQEDNIYDEGKQYDILAYLNGYTAYHALPDSQELYGLLQQVSGQLLEDAKALEATEPKAAMAIYQLVAQTNVNQPSMQQQAADRLEDLMLNQVPKSAAIGEAAVAKLSWEELYSYAQRLEANDELYEALFYANQAYNREGADQAAIGELINRVSGELLKHAEEAIDRVLHAGIRGQHLEFAIDKQTANILDRLSITATVSAEVKTKAQQWKAFGAHLDNVKQAAGKEEYFNVLYHANAAEEYARTLNKAEIVQEIQKLKEFKDAIAALYNEAGNEAYNNETYEAALHKYNLLLMTDGIEQSMQEQIKYVKDTYLDKYYNAHQYANKGDYYKAVSVLNSIEISESMGNVTEYRVSILGQLHAEANTFYNGGFASKEEISAAYARYKLFTETPGAAPELQEDARAKMKEIEEKYNVNVEGAAPAPATEEPQPETEEPVLVNKEVQPAAETPVPEAQAPAPVDEQQTEAVAGQAL
ncbi:MAG: hypothetical protein ACE3JP_16250 [Ectobacillus sp.]